MASLKNSPGEYCLEQKAFCNQQQYLHYKNSRVPQVNKLPGLGINAGNMSGGYYDNVLSNNTANIESNLFGIKQIDLTKKQTKFVPSLNKLDCQEFFKTPRVFVPEPLVIQKGQRPIGPYGGM
tara:strand:+ start:181 stop:549 length:369 start_codon:yes stop_codon:yes gene_type:complete